MQNDTSQSLEGTKLLPIMQHHPSKWIVDIGANDGFNLSNSNLFIREGWMALLVEPVPKSISKAKVIHGSNRNVKFEEVAISNRTGTAKIFLNKSGEDNFFATLETEKSFLRDKFVGENFILVKTEKLNVVLKRNNVPLNFAILTVDVEGYESEVLENLGNYQPSVIIVERNLSSLSKALAKQKILTGRNYVLAARIGCNEIYIDTESEYIEKYIRDFEEISSIGI